MTDSHPRIETDAQIVSSFLSDAAHVSGGHAAGVAFPRSVAAVATLVGDARAHLAAGRAASVGQSPR